MATAAMASEAWKKYVSQFLEVLQQELPDLEWPFNQPTPTSSFSPINFCQGNFSTLCLPCVTPIKFCHMFIVTTFATKIKLLTFYL